MGIKKKKSRVGLDIGSFSLKIMEVATDQKQLVMRKIGIQELPAGSLEQVLPQALKSLFGQTHIDTKDVNISVAGSNVVVRFVELPLMQDAELAQALPYEAEKHIPFDIKETILDYVVLTKNQTERKVNALLVGVRKNFIDSRLKILGDMGIIPDVVDVDSFAVFNAFQKNVPDEAAGTKTIALVNIGASLTSVIIVHENRPWMVRDVNVGGADFTQVIQAQMKMDAQQARQFKHKPKDATDMSTVIRGVLQKLVDEIKLSLGYYEDKHGKGIEHIYVSGGSTKLVGLIPALKESAGIEVTTWDPLASFAIGSDVPEDIVNTYRSSLAVCSGLVLRK
jgi:type IV pilus assembly protein PilM